MADDKDNDKNKNKDKDETRKDKAKNVRKTTSAVAGGTLGAMGGAYLGRRFSRPETNVPGGVPTALYNRRNLVELVGALAGGAAGAMGGAKLASEDPYWHGFKTACEKRGVSLGRVLGLAATALGGGGVGYYAGKERQKDIDKELYGLRIHKLLRNQRARQRDTLAKRLLGTW